MNQPTSFTYKAAMLWAVFVISALFAQAQIAKFGNSYVNVSKRATGGTVQPGDTLEIRTCANFETNFNNANGRLVYRIRYVDNIPSNTVYIPGSMRTITNEGLTYKTFTDAAGDDAGIYNATPSPTQFNIRMNTARTATATSSTLANNIVGATNASTDGGARDKPRVGNGILISTAFRVRVTGVIGDSITLGAGQILYRLTNAGTDQIFNAIQYKILISNNDPICSNSVGRNFVAEAGGTFDSGFVHNRSYGPSFLIPSYTYRLLTVANQIGDGFYTIVNNLSPNKSIRINSRKQPNCTVAPGVPALDSCKNRMFTGHWDIIGDHTGSTTAAGNPPKDSTNPAAGGYMLVVNADYATSEAYRQVITGLCPNTSYEFSLWVRNVCTNCGIDSNATQTWQAGVYPNLTFAIDGLDRYSSGQIDTVGWNKKGFLFKTGSAQTSITISIRNNASGGGGNDWAIDDIALVTCNPNLNMQPTPNANVCINNQVNMFTAVRAFFNNYVFWTWEKSINGGATWNPTGQSGVGTPVLNAGAFEYTATFPSFLADSAAHQNRYRFKVASTAANLANPNCAFIDSTVIVILVNNCNWVLKTKVLSVNGQLMNGLGTLHWKTANEEPNTIYEIERSDDNGQHYKKIGTVAGQAPGNGTQYTFPDNHAITGQTFYRIRVVENGNYDFSRTVLLSNKLESSIRSLINPFNNELSFELIVPTDDVVTITLVDMYGRIIKQAKESVERGLNSIRITGLQSRITGTYTLRVQTSDKIINRQVLKIN